jgi:hypothetical protein
MNRFIVRWITPPTFEDERKTRTASLVNISLLVLLAGALLFFIVAAAFSAESRPLINRVLSMAVVTMIGLKIFLHLGLVRLAGTLLSLMIWLSFTIPLFVFDGIRDAALTGYFIVIVMTSLMLGSKALIGFTALILLSVAGAFYAEDTGVIAGIPGPPDPLDFATVLITLGVTSLLTGAAMHLINEMYARARRNEAAVFETNRQLETLLARVKTLRGLLPICAHCKKIRDDTGYWNQVETYITQHSEADFSHGICPECAEKYFPDMDLYGDNETGARK